MGWRGLVLAALVLSFGAGPARAVPIEVALTPQNTAIRFRAFALSLLPLDGGFTRFRGRLTYDPLVPGFCRVRIRVEVGSLRLASAAITRDVLSPRFLDPQDFPLMRFSGACRKTAVTGVLTLHGVSHAFLMSVHARARRFFAEGRLRRALWGITARPVMAGPMVRIRVIVRLAP